MSLPSLGPEFQAAFVLESQLTLAPIASALKSRRRDEGELEPSLADELLRSTVAVEQTAGFLGLDDVSRLSCSIAAILHAMHRGEVFWREGDLALLTRAFDRLHEAVGKPDRRGDAGVAAEIVVLRQRLTAGVHATAGR